MSYDRQFNVNQDRTIDSQTAQRYCVGCPHKGMLSSIRGSGQKNPIGWDAAGGPQAAITKATYTCNSPNFSSKTMLMYQMSSTIGMGFCPFMLDKWKLRESNSDPDDPSMP